METILRRRNEIEREFDEPLKDVVAGFAKMGYSRPLVAEIMEVDANSLRYFTRREKIRFPATPREHREIKGRPPRLVIHNGREQSLTQWASDLGLSVEGVRRRLIRTGRIQ